MNTSIWLTHEGSRKERLIVSGYPTCIPTFCSFPLDSPNRTLSGLGITPHGMAAILPSYLKRFRRTGEYDIRPA